MDIEQFEESKLRFKNNCTDYTVISKIIPIKKFKDNLVNYIIQKNNIKVDKLTEQVKKDILYDKARRKYGPRGGNYNYSYVHGKAVMIDRILYDIFESEIDTLNTFVDEDGNYCILYDSYDMKFDHEIKIMNEFMQIMEINEPIEIFKLNYDMRDPPFLKWKFHRRFGVLLRMTPNKINSNTKSANKR